MDSCKLCGTEKSDYSLSKRQLQSPALPVQKWKEVSIHYITDLSDVEGMNSVVIAIDKSTRMTHLIACSKSVTVAQAGRLYMREVAKLNGIPSICYSDRGTQFTSKFWKELWRLFGTQLRFTNAYHPHMQGIVE